MPQIMNPSDYIFWICFLELDRLGKYLSWFEIMFKVALWN